MNKRILSVVLALTLCFTLCATSFADVVLMKKGVEDTVRERGWEFQAAQKATMEANLANGVDQLSILKAAYNTYNSIKESEIRPIAEQAAETLLLIGQENGTLDWTKPTNVHIFDFVRWFTMRQIYEGLLDVSIDDPEGDYQTWLEEFKTFEDESDTHVSAETPSQSLDQLKPYSSELSNYYMRLMEIYWGNSDALTGADAEKFKTYAEVEKKILEVGGEENLKAGDLPNEDKFRAYLEEDALLVTTDTLMDLGDVVIDGLTFNTQEHDDVVPGEAEKTPLQRIKPRSLKAALLLAGEELANEVVHNTPLLREEAQAIPKDEIVKTILSKHGFDVMDGNNTTAVDALYAIIQAASDAANSEDFASELRAQIDAVTGLTLDQHSKTFIDYIYDVMGMIDENHGVELVHLNTYIQRALLSPISGTEFTVKSEEGTIDFKFKHNRYPSVDKYIDMYSQLDAVSDSDVITTTGEISEIPYNATAAVDGDKATVTLYRGYPEEGTDVQNDVLRYVGYYTITVDNELVTEPSSEATEPSSEATEPSSEATEPSSEATEPSSEATEPQPGEYTITLEDITDKQLGETITVKGKTNLPFVTVTISKNGETIFVSVYSKAEYEAGIELQLPYGAKVGDEYLVSAGARGVDASDTFKIVGEQPTNPTGPTEPQPGEYTITLENITDKQLGETITVKGTTNLPFLTVSIAKLPVDKNSVIYLSVFSKAEYEAGITLGLPYGAKVGDEYQVSAGARGVDTSDTFRIVEPGSVKEFTLTIAGEDETGTVKKSVRRNSTTNVTAKVEVTNGVLEASDNAEVRWTQTAGEAYAEINALSSTQDNVKDNNLKIKGLKTGKEVATFTAALYVNGAKIAGTDKTVIVTVTSGGGGGGGTTPTQPTDSATTPGTTHNCEWPDIVGHWAHETIDAMTINGYIAGYPDGTFKPDENITRAEFATIAYRILGLSLAQDGVEYDDTVGHWAEGIIATMSLPEGYGMLRGYGDGNFGPNDLITREQAIAIIARAKSSVWTAATEGAKEAFTDAEDISWWFDGEIDSAATNGLIEGYEDGSLKPLQHTTRAEACVLLARAWPEVLTQKSTAQE